MIDKQINFPNVKINIGLNIVAKRCDGYHDLQTVFYPVNFTDSLEIMPSEKFIFQNYGIKIDCEIEKNLCYKAYKLLQQDFNLPAVKFVLYKHVPYGSGLGGGSSDAAFTIKMLNDMFCLNLNDQQMIEYAGTLGADCAFFIKNKPVFAEGRGEIFTDIELSLKGKFLVLILPNIIVNTALAYSHCSPLKPDFNLADSIKLPISEWKNCIKNDFETTVFYEFPVLLEIKNYLYEKGAIFSQMSGSGSTIYGIFDFEPNNLQFPNCRIQVIEL